MEISAKIEPFLTRTETISGKKLAVFDNVFSQEEISFCFKALKNLPYYLNDVDSNQTEYSKHWKAEFELSEINEIPVFKKIAELTLEIFKNKKPELKRIHSNIHLYGDMQFPHVDSKNGCTALLYANDVWESKWMGETIFFSDENEALFSIAPKPGRLIFFHGHIIHRAGVPSRECFEPRISLAFKFSFNT